MRSFRLIDRFWDFVTRTAMPLAIMALLVAGVVIIWTVQGNRSFDQCADRWAAQFVATSNARASARDAVQSALDDLIRAVPTTDSPSGAATFGRALNAYIAASDAERTAERTHPLPAAPTLAC